MVLSTFLKFSLQLLFQKAVNYVNSLTLDNEWTSVTASVATVEVKMFLIFSKIGNSW